VSLPNTEAPALCANTFLVRKVRFRVCHRHTNSSWGIGEGYFIFNIFLRARPNKKIRTPEIIGRVLLAFFGSGDMMDAAAGFGLSTQKGVFFSKTPFGLVWGYCRTLKAKLCSLADVKISIGIGPDTGDSQGLGSVQQSFLHLRL